MSSPTLTFDTDSEYIVSKVEVPSGVTFVTGGTSYVGPTTVYVDNHATGYFTASLTTNAVKTVPVTAVRKKNHETGYYIDNVYEAYPDNQLYSGSAKGNVDVQTMIAVDVATASSDFNLEYKPLSGYLQIDNSGNNCCYACCYDCVCWGLNILLNSNI